MLSDEGTDWAEDGLLLLRMLPPVRQKQTSGVRLAKTRFTKGAYFNP